MAALSKGVKKIIPQAIKNIYHLLQAALANVWYGFPSRRLKVIGVTGTNGKTTTVQMIAEILEGGGFKIAVASTINFKIADREWVNDTKFTTLSSWRLQRHLRQAADAGCEYAVVEVTSHALDQNRVWGVDFRVAVITNVSREHLDYHETLEEYARAKEKLFAIVSRNPDGAAVVNLSMDFAENFLKYPAGEKYGYHLGTHNAKHIKQNDEFHVPRSTFHEIIAEQIKLNIHHTSYVIHDTSFTLNLPGEFNVENALAAVCVGLSQNIPLEKISEALGKLKGVPGRMERIENNLELEIIVDYAVTPDSLRKLYDYIAKLKKESGRVIAVFGSCGERDRGKRPIMGKVVGRQADFVIVTNEDPYGEDPEQIINEVFSGVAGYRKENLNSWRILDRGKAIKKALAIARAGDIIVVTGKGAEETMAVGTSRIPWNDARFIREALREQAFPKTR